jgi:putative salt-induced outer membrane protein YdiY
MYRTDTVAFVAAAALAVSTVAFAEDTDGWEFDLNAGLSLTEGNSETLQANLGVATKRVAGDKECTASLNVNYGENGPVTTTESVDANVKHRRAINDRAFGYVNADALYDDIAQVDHRVTIGPGVGMNLMKNDTATLDVEAGVVWIDEDVANVSDDYAGFRAAEYYTRQISETARVWQSLEIVPEFDDFDNFNLVAEIGVEATMTDSINLRVVFKDRYDNTPGIVAGKEIDENDLTLIAGVGIKL